MLALKALSAHRTDARAAVTNNSKLETVGKVARWVSLDRSTEAHESRRFHSSTFAGWNDVYEMEWRRDGGRVVWEGWGGKGWSGKGRGGMKNGGVGGVR